MKRLSLMLLMILSAGMQGQQAQPAKPATSAPVKTAQPQGTDPGERAFKANCSRCHSAPEQIPPSIAGTVVMHMRVRASLSEADQKAILHFFAP